MNRSCTSSPCQKKASWLCQCKKLFCSMHEHDHASSQNHRTSKVFAKLAESTKNEIINKAMRALENLRARYSESINFISELQTTFEKYLERLAYQITSVSQYLITFMNKLHNSETYVKCKIDTDLKQIETISTLETLILNFDFGSCANNIMADGKLEELKNILKKFNEEKSKKCDECSINEFDVERDCTHLICFECLEKADHCKSCVENGKPIYNQVDFANKNLLCSLCISLSKRVKLSCGHFSCNNCKVCNICKLYTCKQCNNLANTLYKNVCSHQRCFQCINLDCFECSILQKPLDDSCCLICKKPDCQILSCGHKSCLNDSIKGCSECPECRKCRTRNEHVKDGYCLPCSRMAKSDKFESLCQNCGKISINAAKLVCGHEACENCYMEKCKICLEPDTKFHMKHSSHSPSASSLSSESPLSICFNCNSTKKIVRVFSCRHGICQKCYNKNAGCKICKILICLNCKSEIDAQVSRTCGHQLCMKCSNQDLSSCLICKSQSFYGADNNEETKVKALLSESQDIKEHLERPAANSPTCIYCSDENAKVQFECGHKSCNKCNNEAKTCDFCRAADGSCPNCSLKELKFKKLKCGHLGCSSCMKTAYCYKCTIAKKEIVKLDRYEKCGNCEKMFNVYVFLICGHACCCDCFSEKGKALNYLCKFCVCKNKGFMCLLCGNFLVAKKTEKILHFECCDNRFCLDCNIFIENKHFCTYAEKFISYLIR